MFFGKKNFVFRSIYEKTVFRPSFRTDFRGKNIIWGIKWSRFRDVISKKKIKTGATGAVLCSWGKISQSFVVYVKCVSDRYTRLISGGKI